ncbi:MurR/RpiR family transcriptional regulator [Bowmanella denitrificans]|uniref:MurR/RpiR family transcriptional regulator n=2 Tax=Bowmanella denitrificans TaxID=366582 RepID=A0ABP3G911_9ALTE
MRDNLSTSELALADYILSQPETIRDLSSQKLAQQAGVSQSSVVKFTQKLGYRGYPDFKFAINDSLRTAQQQEKPRLHGQISLDDSFVAVTEKLLSSKIAVLTNTKGVNELPTYEQAEAMLQKANRILICGVGGSALVGRDFSFKLQKLGMSAMAESDNHVQMANVANYTSKDLLFVISESGETREEVAVTELAKTNGVMIISLTGYGNNSIAKLADVKLYTVSDENSARLSSILARTAQEFVIDTLFILLTQASSKGRKLLEASNQAIREFRSKSK